METMQYMLLTKNTRILFSSTDQYGSARGVPTGCPAHQSIRSSRVTRQIRGQLHKSRAESGPRSPCALAARRRRRAWRAAIASGDGGLSSTGWRRSLTRSRPRRRDSRRAPRPVAVTMRRHAGSPPMAGGEQRMEQPMVEQEAPRRQNDAKIGGDGVEDNADSVSTAISCRRSSASAKAALCLRDLASRRRCWQRMKAGFRSPLREKSKRWCQFRNAFKFHSLATVLIAS